MALYKSQILTQASGSVGGLTFLHGASGLALRARSIPVNRRQPMQSKVRSCFGALAADWQLRTADHKAQWTEYAERVPLVNKLGDSFYASPINHYVRSNTPRVYLKGATGLCRAGPLIFSLGATPVCSAYTAVVSVGGVLTLGFSCFITDAPAIAEPLTLIVGYVTRPLSPGRSFVAGPYQFGFDEVVAVAASQPNVISEEVPFYWNPAGGQRVGVRVEVTREDGRLSQAASFNLVTTAA